MHSTEDKSWTRWIHQVRRAEFDGTMEHVPLGRNSAVLELGCGDGFQLSLLRERFTRVFAIDARHVPDRAGNCALALAEALPFAEESFDLIVSNCVLEHLDDRHSGLKEALRVLKPDGYMAHVVPARFWKAASLIFNPVGYPLRVWEKWRAIRQNATGFNPELLTSPKASRPRFAQVLSRWALPPIHGTYPLSVTSRGIPRIWQARMG